MEKFYIVSNEHRIYKDYFDWKQNVIDVNKIVAEVMESNGIETSDYHINSESFFIYPTENDVVNFKTQLKKDAFKDMASPFKKNSAISKLIYSKLKEANLPVLSKPKLFLYFNACGRFSERLFDIDGTLYASFKNEQNFTSPNGFNEIKASEFWKIVEDKEEKE